jgi:hypothetical protein
LSSPPLWCEARCHYVHVIEDPVGCLETAEGAFGALRAARAARRQGWRVVRGEWCCPACYLAAKGMKDG